MSSERVDKPRNLREVLKGDQSGYRIGYSFMMLIADLPEDEVWPVVLGVDDVLWEIGCPVIVTDLDLLKKIWLQLPRHKVYVHPRLMYINESLGIEVGLISRGAVFNLDAFSVGNFLTKNQFDSLAGREGNIFEWPEGTEDLSAHLKQMTEEEFDRMLEEVRQKTSF